MSSLVRSSAEHGTLDEGTATLLDRSLRFGDRTADELMTPRVRVEALRADARVHDLVELAGRTGFSRFPVHTEDLDDVPHQRGPASGALIPDGGLAALECQAVQRVPAGDHLLVIASVLRVPYVAEAGEPLIRFAGRYPGLR